MGLTWEHAKLDILKFIEIRITLPKQVAHQKSYELRRFKAPDVPDLIITVNAVWDSWENKAKKA